MFKNGSDTWYLGFKILFYYYYEVGTEIHYVMVGLVSVLNKLHLNGNLAYVQTAKQKILA